MMQAVFWVSVSWVLGVYLGYPLLLKALATIRTKPVRKQAQTDEALPFVSILIAAYNEEDVIEATLRNKLSQAYPKDKLEILVVSDESTDRTDEIVQRVSAESDIPVRLFRQSPRQGKTAGLNLLVPHAQGDILVFSDANSHYAPDAVRTLVQNFADPEVGYVTGKMVYTHPDGSLVGDGCSAYMRYENRLRELETLTGSIVGVDGGIDAMRKALYTELRPDQLPDFVQPLHVVDKGYRVIYEPGAILKEAALGEETREFRMRVRVSLRAMWALRDMAHLLNPLVSGGYSYRLWFHKVLRYLVFIPMALAFLASLLLSTVSMGWLVIFALQLFGYLLAYAGTDGYFASARPVRFLSYFVLINAACAVAFWRFLKGEKQVIWQPRSG
ncbi:MAG: glycosyltransferase family 2 protein [Gammaproteobacteria bacterium]|nr:MAG: glycosyltransferase family 2 protein [Gammaproteobacteria bacterium]